VRWLVVVPVKPLTAAKRRLRGAVPDPAHGDLVLAMALDTVAAALTVADVLVVCDDFTVREATQGLGAQGVPDKPQAGLNAALRFGAERATGVVAALTADLPALRPADLAAALTAARTAAQDAGRTFVADRAGTGTTLLTARAGHVLDPRFGADSARAHAASGAVPLAGDWPTLRHDVDTPADLAQAKVLGLGPHTTHLLAGVSHTR
jgi:2-phospho-L-lactate/phosphoenolpyruvate guanylyltransferase